MLFTRWFGKVGLALAVGLTFGLSAAKADTWFYSIDTLNGGSFPGPYVLVEVDRTSSTQATITFTSQSNGGYTYLMSDGGVVAVNTNATVTVSNISWTQTGTNFKPASITLEGSGNEDGWGTYSTKFKNSSGADQAVNSVTFTLTNTSGTWASADKVLDAVTDGNNSGISTVAAHIFPFTAPPDGHEHVPATLFGTNTNGGGPHPPVPEPTSMVLLGGLFAGLGAYGYRRMRLTAA